MGRYSNFVHKSDEDVDYIVRQIKAMIRHQASFIEIRNRFPDTPKKLIHDLKKELGYKPFEKFGVGKHKDLVGLSMPTTPYIDVQPKEKYVKIL